MVCSIQSAFFNSFGSCSHRGWLLWSECVFVLSAQCGSIIRRCALFIDIMHWRLYTVKNISLKNKSPHTRLKQARSARDNIETIFMFCHRSNTIEVKMMNNWNGLSNTKAAFINQMRLRVPTNQHWIAKKQNDRIRTNARTKESGTFNRCFFYVYVFACVCVCVCVSMYVHNKLA